MKYLLHIALAIAALCMYNNSHSQTTNTSGLTTVEVDYTKKSTAVKVPFDIPFTLKVMNLPATVKEISVQVTERKGNISISNVTEPVNGKTSVDFYIPGCSPAKQYDFSIKAYAPGPLTPAQFTALQAALPKDANIASAINLLAARVRAEHAAMGAGGTAPNFENILGNTHTQLVAYIKEAVKQTDPNYTWKEIDIVPPLKNLSLFCVRQLDILEKINTLKASTVVTGDAHTQQILTELDGLKSDMAITNWGTMEKKAGDAEYDRLTGRMAAIKAAFNTAPAAATAGTLQNMATDLDDAIDGKKAFLDAVINNVILPNMEYITVTPVLIELDFLTNARLFITLDAGIAGYAARIDRYISYTGFNIYFREVNKQTPLRYYHGWDRLAATTSFLIGVTLTSVDKANVRKGFIGDKALVVGIGNRLWRFARFNAGVLVHYRYDTSPVFNADRYHTSLSPFVSFSVDIGLKEIFSGVFTGIFN